MKKRTVKKRTRDEKLTGAYVSASGEWVVIPFTPGWVAAQRLVNQGGVVVVSEVRIYPDATAVARVAGEWSRLPASVPKGGVTAGLLRRVPIGAHVVAPVLVDLRRAWKEAAGRPEPRPPIVLRSEEDWQQQLAATVPPSTAQQTKEPTPQRRERGRPSLADDFLRKVAADYNRLLAAGHRDVARRLAVERRTKSRATVRTWIRLARERKMIASTEQGKLPRVPFAPLV